MAILRCTKKLLKELKVKPAEVDDEFDPLGSWHANLLWTDHRKCVLFTHDATLFSFFVVGLKKPDFQHIREIFGQSMFKNLLREGFAQNQIEMMLDAHREIAISKSNNRSVLSSMNELAFLARCEIESQGGLMNTDIDLLNHYLNRIPMGATNMGYGIEELKKLLSE